MIKESSLQFLSNLNKNNNKEWFHANKASYNDARQNFIELVEEIIQGISLFDKDIATSNLDPKKTIMRINRDIRFSADKTPYKSNFFTFLLY
jgi:uncharacterized protein (TIGR02453 family)